MIFDLQAYLAGQRVDPSASAAWDLVGKLADACLSWSARDGNAARSRYQNRATQPTLVLPGALRLSAVPAPLLPDWVAFEIDFELTTPWYSKDDRPLHVLANPVRKDRIFGVPFMSAASWKGLLRWACRMQAGLHDHLGKHGMGSKAMDQWREPDWIVHLFGNERGESEDFSRGALVFYPTWFSKVGFEVINPQSRERRAGTQPIVYEVVPAGSAGTLRLLYAPAPGEAVRDDVEADETLVRLLDAVMALITVYGFSAKRTAGWGLARISDNGWRARGQVPKDGEPRGFKDLEALKRALPSLLAPEVAP